MLPSGSVRQIHYFCRKIIKLGIVRACAFSVFRADWYLYYAQMERAQNSDSETHVEKLNRTSRTVVAHSEVKNTTCRS